MTNSSNLIDSLEVYVLNNPNDVKPHWVSHFIVPTANELLIKIKNKNGNSGFGLATSYSDISPIIKPFSNGLQDFIIGQDPFCPEKIYESISKLTDTRISSEKGWSKEALIRISAALDIACWDLMGKSSNIPLYKLFGGYRNKIPVYVTCGYYREGKTETELREEIKELIKIGHQSFKVKEVEDVASFWNELLIPNLKKRHQAKPVHSTTEMQKLKQRFPFNIRQFNVYNDDLLISGCTVFETKTTAHIQYIAGSAVKSERVAIDYLHHYLISRVFKEKDFFDFGASTTNKGKNINEGLLFWKERFGARTYTQDFTRINLNKSIQLKSILE